MHVTGGESPGPDEPGPDAARLASIVESSSDAILSKSLDGTILTWNPAAERLYGYRADEVVGRNVALLAGPKRPDEIPGILARIALGETVEPFDTVRTRRDGSPVEVSLCVSPILGPDGTVVGASAIARDITEQNRLRREIAELEGERRDRERFRDVVEAAPDAMICVDPGGAVVLANGQCEELFGYRRHELLAMHVDQLVPDAVRGSHAALRARYMSDPRPRPMGAGLTLHARHADGRDIPVEISLSSAHLGGAVVVIAAIRDVADQLAARDRELRLRLESEQLRVGLRDQQRQRLESLGELAGGVAHDFNNLLAVIGNYAEFVGETVGSPAPSPDALAAARADVDQIARATGRAVELVRQLLTFARREATTPSIVDVNGVISEVEPLLRRTIGEHVELTTSLAPVVSPVVADPGQIEQVVVNLVLNARDAMPAGGMLHLETADVDVDEEYARERPALRPGRYARISVADSGVGIDEATLRRVFEPFFTTKPRGEGSGLGLASVYGIVTQADGYVQLYSEPGIGTRAVVMLPATDLTPGAAGDRTERRTVRGGETVLVVEDEPALREVTRRLLARNGFTVLVATSGEEALDMATRHDGALDLLLTDVVMPGMLGNELATRVLAERPEVRVLYMSGYAEPMLTGQGHLEPGIVLLEKPFSESSLLEKVAQALSR